VIYRASSDLGRPNFGATLLQVGPESNNLKIALTFDDRAFHVGWAELLMGWLLYLSGYQLNVACGATDVFQVSDDVRQRCDAFRQQVETLLSGPLRCRIEEIEEGNYKRYLVHNFRRATSASPKKILL
jgi:hypothetical protein